MCFLHAVSEVRHSVYCFRGILAMAKWGSPLGFAPVSMLSKYITYPGGWSISMLTGLSLPFLIVF